MAGPLRAAGGLLASLLLLSCAKGAGDHDFDGGLDPEPAPDGGPPVSGDGGRPDADADVPPGPFPVGCLDGEGRDAIGLALRSGAHSASVEPSGQGCARSYRLTSTQPLRASTRNDGRPQLPDNPRLVAEREGA